MNGVKKVVSCLVLKKEVLGEDVSGEADAILATFPVLVCYKQLPCSSRLGVYWSRKK